MSWENIIKAARYLSSTEIEEEMSSHISPQDKGYPSILNDMTFVAEEEEGKILGYTSYQDMGQFYFVGNNYIPEENKKAGLWRLILNNRNEHLEDKPRITLVNPMEGTSESKITNNIKRMGGVEITEYSQVEDIMDEDIYHKLNILPMYRYGEE
tara:strand:+ start:3492 stop:3953 length:462 start_codon:yes stop_codon:yes gene_type:complete